MADYSTTTRRIPILFAGGCWARRQLHAGIMYVPLASKLRISLFSVEVVSIVALQGEGVPGGSWEGDACI